MGKYFEIIFIYETTVSFKTNLAGIFHRRLYQMSFLLIGNPR
jgi:hypothetical protein